MSTCRGVRSTPGSRRVASSSTIRPTPITVWTAGRRIAGCASPSPAPRWWTPQTRLSSSKRRWNLVSTSILHWHTPDVLRRSDTTSYCNYKGDATYWSAVIGETVVEDVVKMGDVVKVKVIAIDNRDRVKLSRKILLQEERGEAGGPR